MKSTLLLFLLLGLASAQACAQSPETIKTDASGEVITHVTATASRWSAFDGQVDEADDLADLVAVAWGNGSLGLHRGHAPIENVLETFLGISHDEMHVLMEDAGLNLYGVCKHLGLPTENLIQSLVNSFRPFVSEGVSNGVITAKEADQWVEQLRAEFSKRVYWTG